LTNDAACKRLEKRTKLLPEDLQNRKFMNMKAAKLQIRDEEAPLAFQATARPKRESVQLVLLANSSFEARSPIVE